MNKTWKNKYIELNAEFNNLGKTEDPIIVNYKVNDKETKTFKVDNNDYPIARLESNRIKVDENILVNKILTDLYDNNEINPVFLSGESGKYLVEKSGDKNLYYEDDYVYDLYNLKEYRKSKLADYIDKIDDEYLKQANVTLFNVIDGLSAYDCKCLVKNNLRFEKSDEEDKDFGSIKPVFSCDKRKVNGLIKHVKNSLTKHNKIAISNIEDFIKILKKKTKDNFSWEDRKDGVLYQVVRSDGEVFDILVEDKIITVLTKYGMDSFNIDQIGKVLDKLNKID